MSESAGARAVRLIGNLTHTAGPFARQPFDLRPWQQRIIRQLFKTGKDGRRVYRTCLLMLPRKNGKTELAAAIALYCLLFDGEVGGEIYCAAGDIEQASKVYDAMVVMVENDPELDAQVEIIRSQKRIVHRASGSFVRAISAEAYTKHGFNASVVIYDELHVAPNRDLWDVLATSQGARLNPLMIAISTAGYDRHSILWELYQHARRVQENPALDPTFLPILYEMPADADWTDIKSYTRCNPALGDFRSIEELTIAVARATQIPAQENAVRRLYGNQWTEQDERWVSLTAWDACRVITVTPEQFRARLKGRRCYVGLDLSSTKDLTALVGVFPDDEGPGFDVLVAFFVPKENIHERVNRDRVPYDQWVRDGFLIATPGNVVDYDAVRRVVGEWGKEFDVREIGYDPWNATDLVTRLEGQDGFTCVPIRQGFRSLSAPTKALEKAILSQALRHDGQPVLRWNIGNVVVEPDAAGNYKLAKDRSTEKIDGASALVNAIDCLDRHRHTETPKYQMLFLGGPSAGASS